MWLSINIWCAAYRYSSGGYILLSRDARHAKAGSNAKYDVMRFAQSVELVGGGIDFIANFNGVKGIDLDRSVRLTNLVRKLLDTDAVAMLVYGENGQPHRHNLAANVPSDVGGYIDVGGGRSVAGIQVLCSSASDLMETVLTHPGLSRLRDGIRLIMLHEIAHAYVQAREGDGSVHPTISTGTADANGWKGFGLEAGKPTDSETLATLFALAMIERRDGKAAAINAMGAAIAMAYYILQPDAPPWYYVKKVHLPYWRDAEKLSHMGLTGSDYLGRSKEMEDAIVKSTLASLGLLNSVLGTPKYKPAEEIPEAGW